MHPPLAPLLALTIIGGSPMLASAHRLDEYLQATRVAIEAERVLVEMDLTPGAAVAPEVTGWIDANRDGRLDPDEAHVYARQVLRSVTVWFDGHGVALALDDVRVPDVGEMRLGTGIIRLRASSRLPAARSGRHQIAIVNAHRPASSVYLANALVPGDRRVEIVAQRHERDQHGLTIEYELTMERRWARTAWLAAGLAGLVLLGTARRTTQSHLRKARHQYYTMTPDHTCKPKGMSDGSKGR